MAISRGAGTEIIRSALFRGVDSTVTNLIIGVQYHIYTVLSIVVHADNVETAGNWVKCSLAGYDSKAGTTDSTIHIFQNDLTRYETFVWNDKFSFNGYEPADFASGGLTIAADQDKLADQDSGVSQKLYIATEHADDDIDVVITYIDQNNA